uniref:Reverse transcriptase Ty1/copia-type domain-containing protein n=1 Tax=Tanacetum cinerariifolium TaxID=118510 RepID=A0A6L2LEM2_TANCI|nr:hypothetical protein [Tanacetum cinerariifolium]
MVLPAQNINHSAFRSMFEREKLSGTNFSDWFRSHKLVLRVEKKSFVIEQPISPAPAADFTAQETKFMFEKQAGVDRIQKANKKSLNLKGRVREKARQRINQFISLSLKTLNLLLKSTGQRMMLATTARRPTVTRGVVSVSCLVDNGFIQCFTDYGISFSKNNILYFNAIPRDSIYEIDMLILVPNDFKVKDDGSFDQCVSCLSGKMTRKPFSCHTERATDLLRLVHTNVYGPLRQVSKLGYPKETMGYYFYFLPENKIVVVRCVEFLEKNLISQELSGRAVELEKIQAEDTSPFKNNSEITTEVEAFKLPQEEVVPVRRSERTHRAPERLCLNVEVEEHSLRDLNESINYKAALLDLESNKWLDAMNAKIQSIKIIKFDAWLIFLIMKMDVKTAFLHGYLDEDIYMVQPECFIDPKHRLFMDLRKHQEAGIRDLMRKSKNLREVAFILGIKIYRDRLKRLIRLSQSAYMDKFLKRFKMDNSKRGNILMQERLDLNKTQGASTLEEAKHMQNVPYALAVGSIMYAVRCTRPDVVCLKT